MANPLEDRAASSPRWQKVLAQLGRSGPSVDRMQAVWSDPKPAAALRYHLNLRESRLRDRMVLDLFRNGENGEMRPVELTDGDPSGLTSEDREIVALLFGAHGESRTRGHHAREIALGRCSVRPAMYPWLLPRLAHSGRLFSDLNLPGVRPRGPLRFVSADAMYEVRLVVRPFLSEVHAERGYRMWGALIQGDQRYDLETPQLLLSDGLAVVNDELLLVRSDASLGWALRLRRSGAVEFPEAAKDSFLLQLGRLSDLPEIELPAELHWSQVSSVPRPCLCFELTDDDDGSDSEAAVRSPWVSARIGFDYGGLFASASSRDAAVVDSQGRRFFRRDLAAEGEQLRGLGNLDIGIRPGGPGEVRVARARLGDTVRRLVDAGWSVQANGAEIRCRGVLRARLKSSIDWFDLDAELEYAPGAVVKIPDLLSAVGPRRSMVRLSDGTIGLLPEQAGSFEVLARLGQLAGGRLRFLPTQVGILDTLLAGHESIETDVRFERVKAQLAQAAIWDGAPEPPGFKGRLRDYQRCGVAWMRFLRRSGYGGCLADDMGLGKTVQVLCALQETSVGQGSADGSKPSLVVVPKSLVHNWVSEASRFTSLRVLDYTGPHRTEYSERLGEFDVVVTTYGVLRHEILRMTSFRWSTLVLDEAQAIKNPRSQAAKACRLIQAEHRLAISGTPIENGLDELWSLFECLNPGMLGNLADFAGEQRSRDEPWLDALARALKPFMLRRTKSQVLEELPEKTEQVWEIPLGSDERRRYDELRRYYREALQGYLDQEQGLPKARFHVLEALLRLRQAACHPGLLDPTRLDAPSAKVDALLEKLHEIVPRGHKALVFSQFTTLLEVVRRRLERDGIQHAYLDGGTSDRRKTVETFTDNPGCAVFLISLKAGGCGLNLTESDYVFLLDPWWNPAIEAQAIDRAHRMGQKNRVFAYKMIAQDTVEEKILGLQGDKRRLADAIVTANAGPLADLDAEDLSALL